MTAPLTDRQRLELAIPIRLLCGIAAGSHFSCFDPKTGEVVDQEGYDQLVELRELLIAAAQEPIADLPPAAAAKIARRIERTYRELVAEWHAEAAAARVAIAVVHFTRALVDAGVLVLHEGSAVARAGDMLISMVEYALEEPALARAAEKSGRRLLERCQALGFYAGVTWPAGMREAA
jgi:hypothetical protein